jgi:hypothetical protein
MNKDKEKKVSYTDFIMSGGEVFPKDMYLIKRTLFRKIRYYPTYQIL